MWYTIIWARISRLTQGAGVVGASVVGAGVVGAAVVGGVVGQGTGPENT